MTLILTRQARLRRVLAAVVAAGPLMLLGACGGGGGSGAPAEDKDPHEATDPTSGIVQSLAVVGPVAVSDTSYPFGRARNVDLEAKGYEELEYFVSGKANVYGWSADNSATVRTADAAYTNRIIVIRPKDPARANGKVMVDILNATVGWDFNKVWAVMHDHLLEDGWTYIGVTSKASTALALKVFDPVRYADISWKNPLAADDPENCAVTGKDTRETENGLLWDILTHVGALAKSRQGNSPLKDYAIKSVYMSGFSQSGGNMHTYANAIHPLARLSDGAPVYDGYLQVAAIGGTPLNQCDTRTVADTEAHYTIMPRDVPFISINGAKDVYGYIYTHLRRRADSDAIGDRYRLYEVPGGSHSWTKQLAFNVEPADVLKTGNTNPNVVVPANCDMPEPNDFPMHYVMNAALDNLDKWRQGVAVPPRADWLAMDVTNAGPTFVYDADNNVMGGYRTPYVEVPAAAYLPTNNPACNNWGHVERFSADTLRQRYVNQANYVSQVYASTWNMISAGYLTTADGQRILDEASRVAF